MKKLLLLPLFLISCQSDDEMFKKETYLTVDKSLAELENTINRQFMQDSLIDQYKLDKFQSDDSTLAKYEDEYLDNQLELLKLSKDSICNLADKMVEKSPEEAYLWSTNLENYIETLRNENLRTFFILYKKKQRIAEDTNNIGC